MNLNIPDSDLLNTGPLNSDYVFVVAYRNQEKKILRCLESILALSAYRSKFELIVVDDRSRDRSVEKVGGYLGRHKVPYTLVANRDRKYYTQNLHMAVHLIDRPESVVIEVDGDDFLAPDKDILGILDENYKGKGCLQTFGSFKIANPDDQVKDYLLRFHNEGIPHDQDQLWDALKCCHWSPLKTYQASLFKRLPREYFLERDSGDWLKMGEDNLLLPGMMEMAGKEKVRFIEEVLYYYDVSGAEHDFNAITNRSYLTFKLAKPPLVLGKRDLRNRFSSYEEAVTHIRKYGNSLNGNKGNIFYEGSKDPSASLWKTPWKKFHKKRPYLLFDDPELDPVPNDDAKGTGPNGSIRFTRSGNGKGPQEGLGLIAFLTPKASPFDLSNNKALATLDPSGAHGIEVTLSVEKRAGQVYSITLNRLDLTFDDQYRVLIPDSTMAEKGSKVFRLDFPSDGEIPGLGPPPALERNNGFRQELGPHDPWRRDLFYSFQISAVREELEADLFVEKIEFY